MSREKALELAKSIVSGRWMSLEFDEPVEWYWLSGWRAQLESATGKKYIVQKAGDRTIHVRLKGSPKASQS